MILALCLLFGAKNLDPEGEMPAALEDIRAAWATVNEDPTKLIQAEFNLNNLCDICTHNNCRRIVKQTLAECGKHPHGLDEAAAFCTAAPALKLWLEQFVGRWGVQFRYVSDESVEVILYRIGRREQYAPRYK